MRSVRVPNVAVEKQYVFIILCVCVSVFLPVTLYVKRMRPIIFSSVARLTLPYLCTLSHERHEFGKKGLNIKCDVLIFSTILSEKFLILRRIQKDIIINVHRSSRKVPDILVRF